MVGPGKLGALVLAFVAPFWLQGCDPEARDVFNAAIFPIFCVPEAEIAYLNNTVGEEGFNTCVEGLHGKVANASYCCLAKYYLEAVPLADAQCCDNTVYAKLLENVTNETLKEEAEKRDVESCHEVTKNQTIQYKAVAKTACAPVVESTTSALDKEALHVLYMSEVNKAKDVAEEGVKDMRKSTEMVSSQPAGVAAVFLLAGTVTACLAYGLMAFVKRVRAQRDRESGYNKLLA